MMLTSTFFTPPQQQYYSTYAPPRSSPLSERSANITPRLFTFDMASNLNEKKPTAPQRAFKPNPVMQTRDAATKRRRDMFFKRVQNNREDKKWEMRGDQIQHLDYVSDRKRWEAEKTRQAPPEIQDFDEEIFDDGDETDLPIFSSQWEQERTEADRIAAQEDFELQQLIASMEREDQENDVASQHFGSDDEDYDALFMECMSDVDESNQQQHYQEPQYLDDGDAMDMDMMDC